MIDNKQQLLTLLWLGIQINLMAFVICGWVAAGNVRNFCNEEDKMSATINHQLRFYLVWQTLLAIFTSILGTLIMKRYRNRFSIGFFIGIIFLMCNNMLCTAVLSGGEVTRKKYLTLTCIEYSVAPDRAVTTFSVFLFLLYGIFGVILLKVRDELDSEPNTFTDTSFEATSTEAFTASGTEI